MRKIVIELVGAVPVDGGNVVVIDACNLNEKLDARCVRELPLSPRVPEIGLHVNRYGVPVGVEVHTRDGDGVYPVYVLRDSNGDRLGVFVSFFEGEDAESLVSEIFPGTKSNDQSERGNNDTRSR